MTTQADPLSDFLRAHELPHRFPVLGRSTWNAIVARGDLRTFKIGRARLVRISDVVAFLEGHSAFLADAAQGGAR